MSPSPACGGGPGWGPRGTHRPAQTLRTCRALRRCFFVFFHVRADLGEIPVASPRAVVLAALHEELLVLLERPAVGGLAPDAADERHLLDGGDVLVDLEGREVGVAQDGIPLERDRAQAREGRERDPLLLRL